MNPRLLVWASVVLVGVAAVLAAQVAGGSSAEYKTRVAALKDDDAAGHFELAKWALSNGLYAEVGQEADKLLALDQGDERGKYLKKAAQFYASGGASSFLEVEPAQVTPPAADRPPANGTDTTPPAGDTTPPAPAGPKKAVVYQLTDEEAEAIFKEIGAPMVAFQRTAQPILFSSCAGAKCHGGTDNGTEFYIETQRRTDRKTVAANFKSVDRYIDHSNLAKSRLLRMVLAEKTEHPGGPVFRSNRDQAYQSLEQWVKTLKEGIW
ncbi:MAG: hypothetical protein GXY74_09000 [Phycisphaerae bacterium]|nr:hypothetical protein [Phycisphaerae bacterium]